MTDKLHDRHTIEREDREKEDTGKRTGKCTDTDKTEKYKYRTPDQTNPCTTHLLKLKVSPLNKTTH